MAVFRVEKNKSYTVMSNHHLRNRTLSLKAKGLLSQMLSLPEDWDYTLAGLAINKESRMLSVPLLGNWKRRAMVRRQTTDARVSSASTSTSFTNIPKLMYPRNNCQSQHLKTVRNTASIITVVDHPLSEKPDDGKPMTDNPSPENPTQLNTKGLNTDELSTDQQTTILSYPILSIQT